MSSFESVFGKWLVDSVSVETYAGAGFDGSHLSTLQEISGVMIDEENKLIRNSDGNEVTSSVTIFAPHSLADSFALHSKVTLPSGRITTVLAISIRDVPGVFQMAAINCE